ncbi:MAG: hypothetical protein NTZ09_04970 [Candidatus Hydrogenedentes bacterium]|nr:hypothetical protein [Candidatus Hydrogenedentota bacterium]
MKNFFKKNWFPLILAAAFALAGSLPYLYAYTLETPDSHFMGFVGRGVFGHNGYLMLARQAQAGLNLMENLLAPEPLPRVFFNLEWWLFGKMARWTGLSLVATFHIWRIAIGFLFALSIAYLLRECLATEFQRRFALALIMLGSGFGWVILGVSRVLIRLLPAAHNWVHDSTHGDVLFKNVLMQLPPDVAGVSAPGALVIQPHFMMAAAFASLTCAFLIKAVLTTKTRYYLFAGLAALAHSIIRPYNIPEIYLMFALYPALLWARDRRFDSRKLAGGATAGAVVVPMVVYYAWLAHTGALGGTGPTWHPGSLFHHVLWLGLPFVLALPALFGLVRLRNADPALLLMGLWLVLAFLIEQSYPWYKSGQEAAFPAYIVAPAILATAGPFRWIYRRLHQRRHGSPSFKRAAATLLILLSMPSFLVAYRRMFTDLETRPAPYYISSGLRDALRWLEQNAQKHDTVLASFETGQLIPRLAGVKSFQGHYMITPNASEKRALAERFYGTRGDEPFKLSFARQYAIRYIILGPLEKRPEGFYPADHPWLQQVFSRGDVQIYRVALPS